MRKQRVRVLIDANIYLSFLVSPQNRSGSIEFLIEAAFTQRYRLLLPIDLIDEVAHSLETKPFFKQRVDPTTADQFLNAIKNVAEHIATPPGPLALVTRDPKDDYLIACAISSETDYLVSGDKDLLVIGDTFHPLKIRTPSAFLPELD